MNATDSEANSPTATQPAVNSAPSPAPASPAPEAAPAPAAPDSAELLATAKKEAADNYDRYVRSVADLENHRRRTVREKEELRQFAASRVLEDLLPVIDNLGLGLAAAKAPNADLKTLVGGISMVAEQLKSSLANHGLKEVNPLGLSFDPNLHEAISQQPSAEVAEGSVITVVRVGFTLNGRLLRPASVIVSTGPAVIEATTA
ncbi:MAG: nucleotide exchange factor GrpE [Opitutus sp.]|nr:nucleotide exchange factor GrpE [Opitutus sp.]MCS6248512.1 nucleotide exchange factor GrpE [Opitutus sp.]MCS6274709.1 nucleotide exchange factor GrpE [Opitutus sp.]MCS6276328.1 nucleotide exchange factor GrpE [Opitutus sp.]MCS6302024.1 nucleotide exchange factor GrpE [Opitutus sp.]